VRVASAALPSVRPLLAFARMAFLEHLAYRLRYVVGILNYTIYMGVQYFLWSAVYSSAPPGTTALGGFTFPQIITYFAVGWVVRVSCFNNIDREIADRVSQGDIVLDLLRPPSLLVMRYGAAVGETVFRVFFMAIPTALVLFPLFGVEAPPLDASVAESALSLLEFAVSVALAFHLFFLINFLIGVSAVYLEKIRGFLWAKFILVQFLSGLLVPYDLFPPWARTLLAALPFRGMVYGPIAIYIGHARGAEALRELALQAGWTIALWLLARRFWSAARRKLMAQGG
jgi:viologen exporter family transport system permease protein